MTTDLVGYGSLIDAESRARTGLSCNAIPVEITGLQRAWNYVGCKLTDHTFTSLREVGIPEAVLSKLNHLKGRMFETQEHWRKELTGILSTNELAKFPDPLFGQAALGVYLKEGAVTNGVVVSISNPESELPKFDKREDGYTRYQLKELPHIDVKVLNGQPMPADAMSAWVYIPDDPRKPAADCPIIQSYVDVVLTGCFVQFGEAFARKFIRTTELWECSWIDDRHRPVYPRTMPYVPLASHIDRVLAEEIPSAQREFLCKGLSDSNREILYAKPYLVYE